MRSAAWLQQAAWRTAVHAVGAASADLDRFTHSLSTPSSCTAHFLLKSATLDMGRSMAALQHGHGLHLACHDLRPRPRVPRHADQTPRLLRTSCAA